MAKKAGTSLGLQIFLTIGFLVLLMAASAIGATLWGRNLAREAISTDLRRTHSAQAVLQQQRYRHLELAAQVVTIEGWAADHLAAAAAAADDAAIRARVEEFRGRQSIDLVVFLDAAGKVVFRGGASEEPEMGWDFSADALLVAGQQKKSSSGLWPLGGELYHAVLVQQVRDFELLGYVALASSIAPLADELERISGAEIVYFVSSPTGPSVISSTHDDADAVIAALRREGQGLTRVKRGETVWGVDLALGDEPWLAFLAPLRDAADTPAGATVALVRVSQKLAAFQQMQWLLAAVAGGALLIALVAALALGRRVLGPVNRLAAAAREVSDGNYDGDFPPAKGHFGPLIEPLANLNRRLRDRQSLEGFLQAISRELPEPARSEVTSPPLTRQVALVAVEMRRFANPKLGYDPEENVGRFARDVRRISAAITSRQGRVEAIFGHRLLALFEGEGHTARALAAATELLLILTNRENAFDEPVAPVVALTKGLVVTGSIRWGTRTDMAVAGLPVQQLESLMREATPGELYFSKQIAEELAEPCQRSGIELRAQRGLMSPQPLYQMSTDVARRLTGVQAPPSVAQGLNQSADVALTDLVPGEVLGGRFEILADLGSGPSGAVFKSRDRDRGNLVKLKILDGEVLADAARLEHVKQVLEQLRVISHPNVAGVLDFGQAGGLAYVSAPFERGLTLRYVLAQCGNVPLRPAFLLAQQILEGLAAAHRQRLAHGGLKPENVLVGPTGQIKVMDFGLGQPLTPATRDAAHPGAAYLAPEQVEGHAGDSRADVFAWGAVFYEMATGQVPTDGTTPSEVAAKRLQEPIELPSTLVPDLPQPLEAILLRCLETDPGARFGSIEELVREIEALRG